ncbi:MAG: formate dehydrogenase subunit gamma [bacterium]
MRATGYVSSSSLIERIGHWGLASASVVLLLTGCGFLFSPLRGLHILAGGARRMALVHRIAGNLFSCALLISFLVWIRECWPNAGDLAWLKSGRPFGSGTKPSQRGKFNAAQKIYFWGVIFFGLISLLSGWSLSRPSSFSPEFLAWCYALHTLSAAFFVMSGVIHVYIRIFINPGALTGITLGRVSRSWAHHHRGKWLEKVEKQMEDY